MSIPLILFAKAPVPGKVKTRLQTDCSAEQAAEIAKVLMQQTVASAKRYWPGEVVLYVWPDEKHEFLQHLITEYKLKAYVQAEGDLGRKMHHALSERGYPAVVMGCDVPHCPECIYHQAYQVISQGENVIGPSIDGGYYLLGLQQAYSILFENMQWGVDSVLAETLSRAQANDVELHKLPELNDIDEWGDLQQIAPQLPALASFLRNKP